MLELLATFTIKQILVYFVLLCLAIRGAVSFFDWGKEQYQKKFNIDYVEKTEKETLKQHYKECNSQHQESIQMYHNLENKIDNLCNTMNEKINDIEGQLKLLSSSSRNDIKAWIVETHHKAVKEQQIDDFTRDVVEKRFEDYRRLGGNSYIESLVKEIRELPMK